MATVTVNNLTTLATVAADDIIPIWDLSAGQYKGIVPADLLGGTLTGGGVVATQGYTLTVPATGTTALLATANTFTKTQSVVPASTADTAVYVNMPTGTTGYAWLGRINGANRSIINHSGTNNYLHLYDADYGNGEYAPMVYLGRNTNSSTPTPPSFAATRGDGTIVYLFPDTNSLWRTSHYRPTYANQADINTTVVGDQTSMAEAKIIDDQLSSMLDVLARIAAGAESVRRFVYRSGAYDNQAFEGVVTDYAPEYGKDRGPDHPQGKALNQITIIGDLLRTVDSLVKRVAELEAKLGG